MRRLTSFAFVVALAVIGCRGGDNPPGGDDDPTPDGPPVGGEVTIQEIQDPAMPEGTVVEIKGVVVTAIDAFGARTGDLWVQDPAGGEFSGIKVFGAPLDIVATLVVGDTVNISNAEKDEFALTEDTSGRTVTEIKGAAGGTMVVVKTGSGTAPTPVTVDASAIEALDEAARDLEWEKWEGVLINVTNARQVTEYGPFSANSMAEDQQEFEAAGRLAVQSVLANLGTPAELSAGTCYESIVGVGDYFFNHLLLPRSGDDLTGGGDGCTALAVASIADVQAGTAKGTVLLENVFVVAKSFNNKNLWVSTSLNANANEGLFVFRGNGASNLSADVVPGARVDVLGFVLENNNDMNGDTNTQLTGGAVSFKTAAAGAPVGVTNQTAATLTVAGTGEPFESVLVTLTNVKVNVLGDQANFGVGQMQQGATTFLSDDDVFRLPATELDKCYASITGLWTYQVFDNVYGFLPLAVGTGTGTCL